MVNPLSAASFGSAGMSAVKPMGGMNVTPVAPRISTTNINVGGIKMPTMNINTGAPKLSTTNVTPVQPSMGMRNTTPIQPQQFGAVNKSVSQPSLPGMSLVGQNLGITKVTNRGAFGDEGFETVKSPGTLFHGSTSNIPTGATIKPSNFTQKSGVSFATTDARVAGMYASHLHALPDQKPVSTGTVYSVEAPHVAKDIRHGSDNTSNYVSQQFKVKEPAYSVDYKTGSMTPLSPKYPPIEAPKPAPKSYQPSLFDQTKKPSTGID